LPEDAGQCAYSLREVFNSLRWIVRAGAPWRMMPNDLPPWWMVYQQTQRWLAAGCFATVAAEHLAALKTALQQNLAQVEAQQRALEQRLRPQTLEEVKLLEQKLQEALEELRARKAELQSPAEPSPGGPPPEGLSQ